MLRPFTEPITDPITRLEMHQWRKQRRQLSLTFLGFPLLLSAALWFFYLAPQPVFNPELFESALLTNVWGLQVLLSVWLNVVVTLRAASAIARERESRNWTLLKLTPYSTSDIFRGKSKAIWAGLAWPIGLVLALRIASLLLSYVNSSNSSLTESVLTALFIYVFCTELLVSVYYNCAIGLLASTLAKTSAQAHGAAYVLHLLLFVFCFAFLWWNYLYGSYGFSIIFSGSNTSTLWTTIAHYFILCLAQLTIGALSNSLAVHLADRFTD